MLQPTMNRQSAPASATVPAPTNSSRHGVPMLPHSARQAVRWAACALLLNLLWEVAQLPFYLFAPTVGPLEIAWDIVHCAAGDVGIALASFGAAALAARDPEWPVRRPWLGLAIALVVGLVWTVHSEWQNVYARGAWAYAPSMPTIAGVGVLPLLQWLLLPPLGLVMVRRWHDAVASGNGAKIQRAPSRGSHSETG
jgi:hypothetical protein